MAQRLRNWCFTSYDLELFKVPDDASSFRYCVYQTEECPKTGAWHNQGYIEFSSAVSFQTVKDMLGDPTVHLEARIGTRTQARAYCMKPETRVAGPMEFGVWHPETGERAREDLNAAREIIQTCKTWFAVLNNPQLANTVARYGRWAREVYENRPLTVAAPEIILRNWQNEVCDLLDEDVHKRRIIWIWSKESGTGKTTMFDYISSRKNVLPGVDYANVLFAFDNHDIIWFDLSRFQTDEHIPYHALEKLSNETFHLSTKYTPCRKYISAHVVVTANVPPNEEKIPERCIIIHATK